MSCPVTAADGNALSEVWPEVARSLRPFLRRKGVPAAAIDDVVQDVAVAAVAQRVAFADANDLLRWARVVAIRRLWRERAAATRALPYAAVPERAAVDNVEDGAVARRELAAVIDAALALRQEDLSAFQAAATREGSKRERDRLSLRLHRARQRLRAGSRRFIAALLPARADRWFGFDAGQLAAVVGSAVIAVGTALGPNETVKPRPAAGKQDLELAAPVALFAAAAADIAPAEPAALAGPVAQPHGAHEERQPPSRSPLVAIPLAGEPAEVGTADNGGRRPLVCYEGPASPQPVCVDAPAATASVVPR